MQKILFIGKQRYSTIEVENTNRQLSKNQVVFNSQRRVTKFSLNTKTIKRRKQNDQWIETYIEINKETIRNVKIDAWAYNENIMLKANSLEEDCI